MEVAWGSPHEYWDLFVLSTRNHSAMVKLELCEPQLNAIDRGPHIVWVCGTYNIL